MYLTKKRRTESVRELPLIALTAIISALLRVSPALATCPNTTVPSGSITYAYDSDDRLIGVVNVSASAATYQYDVVGNLLSISRPTEPVLLLSLSPNNGPSATCVTIYGRGYSSTASQNTVTFNGTSAPVLYSTATTIVVAVPSGASTGNVTVTSPSGLANGGPFTVTNQ